MYTKPNFPMLARAWTFQEQLLAPRVLYLGPQELLWGCYEHHTCECSDARYDESYEAQEINKAAFYDVCLQPEKHSRLPHYMLLKVVGTYSNLKLTYTEDFLPAISALANTIVDRGGGEYLASLWIETLLLEMCWFALPREGSTISNCLPWRAPSWSWASVDIPVRYPSELSLVLDNSQLLEHAKVYEAVCTLPICL
jgi:hypothetical protein